MKTREKGEGRKRKNTIHCSYAARSNHASNFDDQSNNKTVDDYLLLFVRANGAPVFIVVCSFSQIHVKEKNAKETRQNIAPFSSPFRFAPSAAERLTRRFACMLSVDQRHISCVPRSRRLFVVVVITIITRSCQLREQEFDSAVGEYSRSSS